MWFYPLLLFLTPSIYNSIYPPLPSRNPSFMPLSPFLHRSIPQHRLEKINDELEQDVLIRAIYDVKGIDMGTGLVRYKAEVDFDGRELTRFYLDQQDLEALLKVGRKK